MSRTPEKTLQAWLRRLNIPVSKALISRQLKGHPDYPSLLSITDTLEYLDIENAAVQVEKNLLHEVTTPFLAHLKTNGGEFVMAENRDTLEKTYPGFFDSWSGVVVMAEKKPDWQHKENDALLKKEKEIRFKKNAALVAVLVVALAAILFSPGWMVACLILVALAGVFVSWLIVSKDLGIENSIADQVCGREANCDAVINSAGVKLPWGITWGDIGLTWFGSLLLILIISSFTQSSSGIMALLSLFSVAAIPFTFFSLYYQWRVAKKWCRLCLITVGLLYLQFAVLLPSLGTDGFAYINSKETLILLAIGLFVSIGWFSFKSIFNEKNDWEETALKGMRFNRNEAVFAALLQNARSVDTTPWKNDLQLGNHKAPVQIMVACSPYCGPCAKAHERLHALVEQYSDSVGLTIRFAFTAHNKEDKRTEAVQHMLQHIEEVCTSKPGKEKSIYSRKVLHEWFTQMNYEKFATRFPNTKTINVNSILLQHEEWGRHSDIRFTPTIFINGREMPTGYSAADIAGLMNVLPGILEGGWEVKEPEPVLV